MHIVPSCHTPKPQNPKAKPNSKTFNPETLYFTEKNVNILENPPPYFNFFLAEIQSARFSTPHIQNVLENPYYPVATPSSMSRSNYQSNNNNRAAYCRINGQPANRRGDEEDLTDQLLQHAHAHLFQSQPSKATSLLPLRSEDSLKPTWLPIPQPHIKHSLNPPKKSEPN
jgi:hypothetical protein